MESGPDSFSRVQAPGQTSWTLVQGPPQWTPAPGLPPEILGTAPAPVLPSAKPALVDFCTMPVPATAGFQAHQCRLKSQAHHSEPWYQARLHEHRYRPILRFQILSPSTYGLRMWVCLPEHSIIKPACGLHQMAHPEHLDKLTVGQSQSVKIGRSAYFFKCIDINTRS